MWTSEFIDSIEQVDASAWNGLLRSPYPFLRHAFLHALEASGCVSPDTGWQPKHWLLRDQSRLIAAMPLYSKQHSYGEYVFDWAWADAYQRHGLAYYPKLLSAIPFTPCVGARLLCAADNAAAAFNRACGDVQALCTQERLSSWHILFPDEQPLFTDNGQLIQRVGCQYRWHNRQYESFDHYLESFNARKRKSVRKERRSVAESNIEFVHLPGEAIDDETLKAFYVFYHATYLKRGRPGYLSLPFFQQLKQTMPENLLLVMARKGSQYVAGALFLKDEQTLYGRYWGCLDEYKNLHFETCYYQGLDYCIEQQLSSFDAGAQGEHKIQRGFEPQLTYSYHWVTHPSFSNAIADFCAQEKPQIVAYKDEAASLLPFKQTAA